MTYTIKQVSDMTGIPVSTLRFYDKKGLLPFLRRNEFNRRVFSELDIASLQIIECLKDTGMKNSDIQKFSDWTLAGDSTLKNRRELFVNQREAVERQIAELQRALEIIDYKINYYQRALDLGTEKNLRGNDRLPYAEEFLTRGCKKCYNDAANF